MQYGVPGACICNVFMRQNVLPESLGTRLYHVCVSCVTTHCLLKSWLGECVHVPGGQLWGQKGGHHRMVTVSPMVWCIEFDIHVMTLGLN